MQITFTKMKAWNTFLSYFKESGCMNTPYRAWRHGIYDPWYGAIMQMVPNPLFMEQETVSVDSDSSEQQPDEYADYPDEKLGSMSDKESV